MTWLSWGRCTTTARWGSWRWTWGHSWQRGRAQELSDKGTQWSKASAAASWSLRSSRISTTGCCSVTGILPCLPWPTHWHWPSWTGSGLPRGEHKKHAGHSGPRRVPTYMPLESLSSQNRPRGTYIKFKRIYVEDKKFTELKFKRLYMLLLQKDSFRAKRKRGSLFRGGWEHFPRFWSRPEGRTLQPP